MMSVVKRKPRDYGNEGLGNDCQIRAAYADDAAAVSKVILAALRETNAKIIQRTSSGRSKKALVLTKWQN